MHESLLQNGTMFASHKRMSFHIFKIMSFLPLILPCLGQKQWNELTMAWNLWNRESDSSSLFFKILMLCVLSRWWKPGWHSMGEKHFKNNFELWLVEFASVEPNSYTLITHSYLWTVLNVFQWKWEEGKKIRYPPGTEEGTDRKDSTKSKLMEGDWMEAEL